MSVKNATIGKGTKIWHPSLVNITGCTIGKECNIAAFVEIGPNVVIGDRCKIAAFSFIPQGIIIEDDVFIGPNTVFINDKHPPTPKDVWLIETTVVEKNVSIGAGALILSGIKIGKNAKIGAGAVVTKDVVENTKVKGIPARLYGRKVK